MRAAEQHIAGFNIGRVQRIRTARGVCHLPIEQPALARAALTAAAAVGNQNIGRMRSVENRAVGGTVEAVAVGRYRDLKYSGVNSVRLPVDCACC